MMQKMSSTRPTTYCVGKNMEVKMVDDLLNTQQWRDQMKGLEGLGWDEISIFFDHFNVVLDEIDRLRAESADMKKTVAHLEEGSIDDEFVIIRLTKRVAELEGSYWTGNEWRKSDGHTPNSKE